MKYYGLYTKHGILMKVSDSKHKLKPILAFMDKMTNYRIKEIKPNVGLYPKLR